MVISFDQNIILYIAIGICAIILILIILNIRLSLRVKKLMRGANGRSLEGSFVEMQKEIDKNLHWQKEIQEYLKNIEKRLSTSVRGINANSFNAFQGLDSGGKSFSVAFLNEKGDGVIISSLQARERISVFAKPIKNYSAEVELSDEEKNTLTKARESCNV